MSYIKSSVSILNIFWMGLACCLWAEAEFMSSVMSIKGSYGLARRRETSLFCFGLWMVGWLCPKNICSASAHRSWVDLWKCLSPNYSIYWEPQVYFFSAGGGWACQVDILMTQLFIEFHGCSF